LALWKCSGSGVVKNCSLERAKVWLYKLEAVSQARVCFTLCWVQAPHARRCQAPPFASSTIWDWQQRAAATATATATGQTRHHTQASQHATYVRILCLEHAEQHHNPVFPPHTPCAGRVRDRLAQFLCSWPIVSGNPPLSQNTNHRIRRVLLLK
jgi:hypothetical protein